MFRRLVDRFIALSVDVSPAVRTEFRCIRLQNRGPKPPEIAISEIATSVVLPIGASGSKRRNGTRACQCQNEVGVSPLPNETRRRLASPPNTGAIRVSVLSRTRK